MTTRRWVCPKCNDGVHAPDRPRRDDVRRYCLACSAKVGRLVERICPAHESAAQREADARKASRERKAQLRAERAVERRAMRAEAQASARSARAALRAMPLSEIAKMSTREAYTEAARRYARLSAWERDLSGVEFDIRISDVKTYTSGHAYSGSGRFVVTVGSNIADAHTTIIHELAHLAAPGREHHGPVWRSLHILAVSEVVGRRVEVPGSADIHELHRLLGSALAEFLYGSSAQFARS